MAGLLNWFSDDNNDISNTAKSYSAVSTTTKTTAPLRTTGWDNYPGSSLRSALTDTVPKDLFLIKTGGNALQAVPHIAIPPKNLVSVTVSDGVAPGQTILVAAPGGRIVQAVIPSSCQVGQTFLVHVPPVSDPIIVAGVPLDLALQEETKTNSLTMPLLQEHHLDDSHLRLVTVQGDASHWNVGAQTTNHSQPRVGSEVREIV